MVTNQGTWHARREWYNTPYVISDYGGCKMEGSEPATRPPSPLALHGFASSGSTVREVIEAQRLRAEIRAGRFAGPTAGLAPGVAQANLVVLPAEEAVDFHKFCLSN